VSTARQLTRIAVLAVLACALVYVVALGTNWGLDADARALPSGISGPNWHRAHAAAEGAVNTIHFATIALAAVGAVLVALRRGRRDLAAVAVATLAGANLTTAVLKPLLAHADPFGGEAQRAIDAAFPSGHATAAMSLALVGVIVSPRAWRPLVALVAAVYAGTVGVGLVLHFDHYPSDVVGGYLVAAAWASAMAAITLRHRERALPAPAPLPIPRGTLPVALGLTLIAGALLLAPAERLAHGVFAVSAVAIAALALLLPVALTVVLARGDRGPRARVPEL
jgi:membrane-associated phospholipid phosphatase